MASRASVMASVEQYDLILRVYACNLRPGYMELDFGDLDPALLRKTVYVGKVVRKHNRTYLIMGKELDRDAESSERIDAFGDF